MEQENCVMMHDLNNKIKEQDGFYPMINDFNAFHLMIYEMEHLLEKDVAILNSLANYTYTHQLLKCKAQNDLSYDLSFRLIRYIPLQDLNLRFDIMNIKFYLLSQEMQH